MRPIAFEEGSRELMSSVLELAIEDYRYLKARGVVRDLNQVHSVNANTLNKRDRLRNHAFNQDAQIQELLYFLKNKQLISSILSDLPLKIDYNTFVNRLG